MTNLVTRLHLDGCSVHASSTGLEDGFLPFSPCGKSGIFDEILKTKQGQLKPEAFCKKPGGKKKKILVES